LSEKKVYMYALSTCGWCRKTKALLKELGVDFEFVDVDLAGGDRRREAMEALAKHNPRRSFPTLVIGEEVVVGFDPDKIKGALEDG
jgi:glutaredoxin